MAAEIDAAVERIVALKPDLVLAAASSRAVAQVYRPALSQFQLPILPFSPPRKRYW